jgi:hypothetical protein
LALDVFEMMDTTQDTLCDRAARTSRLATRDVGPFGAKRFKELTMQGPQALLCFFLTTRPFLRIEWGIMTRLPRLRLEGTEITA